MEGNVPKHVHRESNKIVMLTWFTSEQWLITSRMNIRHINQN